MAETQQRLLLLSTTTGYQMRSFVEAAHKLGLAVALGTDRCHVLEDPWQDGALPLRFEDAEGSAQQIIEYARTNRLDAIVSVGDRPTPTAARACRELGLAGHPPLAADICRDKFLFRERVRTAGLRAPRFQHFPLDNDPQRLLASGGLSTGFPCVLKPLALSGSRGVIRADDAEQFVAAFQRIRTLLRSPDVLVLREDASNFLQVEAYIEGEEVAVEAVVDRGRLQVLAIFDKPDPLIGPFFEETLYVTPSRLPEDEQQQVTETVAKAVEALCLEHGPLHAEMRINSEGAWLLEVAARPIGGLCARALRFEAPGSAELISLEELVIRLALGVSVENVRREPSASGVMMIPIPEEGIFSHAEGVDDARATPGVEDVSITAKPDHKLVALPEGSSYLGFIFARGESPEFVENALRTAHRKLGFVISPALPVLRASG
ncbi:MAG: ATP-grasp domain-containing protein [Acidobacteria bacterium]|nr:ATP-grasp domain-containing protein [Acidobacteriota bacterium]